MRKPGLNLLILSAAAFLVACSGSDKTEPRPQPAAPDQLAGEWKLIGMEVTKESEELYILFAPVTLGGDTAAEIHSRQVMCLIEALMEKTGKLGVKVSAAEWLENYEFDEGKQETNQLLVAISDQPLTAPGKALVKSRVCPKDYNVRSRLFYDDETAAIKLTIELDPAVKNQVAEKVVPAIRELLDKPEFGSFKCKEHKPPELKTLAEVGGSAVFVFGVEPTGIGRKKLEIKVQISEAPFTIGGNYQIIDRQTVMIETPGPYGPEEREFKVAFAENQLTITDQRRGEVYRLAPTIK